MTLSQLRAKARPMQELFGVQLVLVDLTVKGDSTVAECPRLSISCKVDRGGEDGVLPIVHNLGVTLESARVSAVVNSLLGSDNGQSSSTIKLPFASVSKFDLTLHCRGGPVGIDDATISCEPFSGSEQATSAHVVDHYTAIVRGRAPYLLIAKTNVAGVNVADSALTIAGKVVTNTSVIGATVGVVTRDMVGSALTQGKESRGASATEKVRIHCCIFFASREVFIHPAVLYSINLATSAGAWSLR